METIVGAVCAPLSLRRMFMQSIAQKSQPKSQVRGCSPILPLSYYGLLQSPPDYRSKATQKASHLTSTQITQNNSDDMSTLLESELGKCQDLLIGILSCRLMSDWAYRTYSIKSL